MTVVLRFARNPERRVARYAIHVVGDGCRTEQAIQRFFHQKMVIERVFNRAAAYVQVAHPAPSVAFRRIPDIVLHAKMRCVCAHHPHAVQFLIGRLEIALVLHRVIDARQLN